MGHAFSAGAELRLDKVGTRLVQKRLRFSALSITARLKSCPDTKHYRGEDRKTCAFLRFCIYPPSLKSRKFDNMPGAGIGVPPPGYPANNLRHVHLGG